MVLRRVGSSSARDKYIASHLNSAIPPWGRAPSVPAFPAASVLDGVDRAAADAGHAVRARAVPVRLSLDNVDAVDRAAQRTLSAADARVRDRERSGFDEELVEDAVHRMGLEPVNKADLRRRKRLTVLNAGNAAVDRRLRRRDDLRRLLRARHVEHGDVVFRHHDLQHAPVIESDVRAQRGDAAAGVADLGAAGHDKVSLPAAGEAAAAQKIGKDVRDLPAVGRRDEHPRPVGVQCGRRVIFDVFICGDQIVAERGGEALGNIAAVARAGIIDDHAVSPRRLILPSIAHSYGKFQPDVVRVRTACYNKSNTAFSEEGSLLYWYTIGQTLTQQERQPAPEQPAVVLLTSEELSHQPALSGLERTLHHTPPDSVLHTMLPERGGEPVLSSFSDPESQTYGQAVRIGGNRFRLLLCAAKQPVCYCA